MPLVGDGRSGAFSTTVTQFGGYKAGVNPAPATYPVGTTRTVSQPTTGIRRVDTTIIAASTVTTQTGTAPAGVQPGDLLIIRTLWSIGTAPSWGESSYSGWTLLRTTVESSMESRVLYRVADGTGADAPPATTTTATAHRVTVVAAYRGVDNTTPFIDENSASEATSQTQHDAPAIINTDPAAWAVVGGAARQVFTPLTWTPGPGLVEWQDADTAVASSNNAAAFWADSDGPVATGSVTYNASTSAATSRATMWAAFLRPAASSGGDQSRTLTDVGSGADALSLTATVPLADTGAGSDAATVAAAVPLADTGSGADAASVAAAVPLSDPRTVADALSVSAAVGLSDVGVGTDALSVTVPIALADTSSSTDALTVTAAVGLADTGSGADALTVAAAVSLTDVGSGTDALSITAKALTLTDTASGADGLAVAAAVPLTDTGAGTDAISVSAPGTPSFGDTGSGADALTVAVSASLTDSGAAADLLAASVAAPLADAATSADALTVTVVLALADTGAAADALSHTATGGPGGARNITVTWGRPTTRRLTAAERTRVLQASALRARDLDGDLDTRSLTPTDPRTRTLAATVRS